MPDKNNRKNLSELSIEEQQELLGVVPPEITEAVPPYEPPEDYKPVEHPVSEMTPEMEEEILNENRRLAEVPEPDLESLTIHNDDLDKSFGPPQAGETEPPDLDELVKAEAKARDAAIAKSTIATDEPTKRFSPEDFPPAEPTE